MNTIFGKPDNKIIAIFIDEKINIDVDKNFTWEMSPERNGKTYKAVMYNPVNTIQIYVESRVWNYHEKIVSQAMYKEIFRKTA